MPEAVVEEVVEEVAAEPELEPVEEEVIEEVEAVPSEEEEEALRLIEAREWKKVLEIGEPAVGTLMQSLRDEDDEIRRSAAIVLGTIGGERAVGPLIQSLQDEDSEVRRRAARSLGIMKSEEAVEPLVLTLEDDDAGVRSRAAASLERLRWKPEDDRERALYFIAKKQWYKLAEMGEAAAGPLSSRVEDEDEEVRNEAGWLLEEIGSAKDLDQLLKNLKDK